MQVGIDLKKIDNYLTNKEFLDNCDQIKKKYKQSDVNNENNINNDKKEKEKYIFFSLDGLLDINKIIIKLQAFDLFYDSYIKEVEKISSEKMEKIIEVNEENINFNENNDNNTNEAKTVTNEQNDTTNSLSNTKNENQKDINENKNQDLQNKKNDSKDIDIINKKKISKKLKINKIKSRSGINLSRTPQDIQSSLILIHMMSHE